MSASPTPTDPPGWVILLRLCIIAAVAVPAGVVTMLAESVGKQAPDLMLCWLVTVGGWLLGLVAYAIGRQIDPNQSDDAFVWAVVTSLIASVVGGVARVWWLIANGL